jgi:hypothetical protein
MTKALIILNLNFVTQKPVKVGSYSNTVGIHYPNPYPHPNFPGWLSPSAESPVMVAELLYLSGLASVVIFLF